MDTNPTTCPSCNTVVTPASYFCSNCGKKIRERPLSTSVIRQIVIYMVSFFIPPYGLVYGVKYLRQEKESAKAVGVIAVILTLVSIMISMIFVISLINTMNKLLGGQVGQSSIITNGQLDQMLNDQVKQYKDLGL